MKKTTQKNHTPPWPWDKTQWGGNADGLYCVCKWGVMTYRVCKWSTHVTHAQTTLWFESLPWHLYRATCKIKLIDAAFKFYYLIYRLTRQWIWSKVERLLDRSGEVTFSTWPWCCVRLGKKWNVLNVKSKNHVAFHPARTVRDTCWETEIYFKHCEELKSVSSRITNTIKKQKKLRNTKTK